MRLRRSIYWANGLALENLKKAIASAVDAICMDLEDGILPDKKRACREATVEVLKNWDFCGKERLVRINKFDSEYFEEDLAAILPCKPDALRIPKAENVEDLLALDERLSKFEAQNGMEKNTIEMVLMIETALGMRRCYELASCCERITAVGIGMEDFTTSIGLEERRYVPGNPDLCYARQKLVLDCRAAGVQAIDSGVLFNGNVEYIREDTQIDKYQGFDGRSVGDLAQVDVINEIFSPSAQNVDWAKRVISGWEDSLATGNSDLYVDGKFVDPPVVEKARTILEKVKQIKAHKVR